MVNIEEIVKEIIEKHKENIKCVSHEQINIDTDKGRIFIRKKGKSKDITEVIIFGYGSQIPSIFDLEGDSFDLIELNSIIDLNLSKNKKIKGEYKKI